MGIHILNYLDDWLIHVQSQVVLTSHKDPPPQPLRLPGAKGQLCQEHTVTQPTSIVPGHSYRLGADNSNCLMKIQCHAASFKEGTARPLKAVQKMLGLMAALFLGTSVGSASYATHPVLVETESCIRGLASRTPLRNGDSGLCISPGLLEETPWLKQGMILNTAHRRKVVMTDASIKGWGALCEGKLTFGLWSEEESGLHINCLEMLAVCQACQLFLPDIRGHHVLVRSDSRSVVSNKSPGRPRLGATLHAVERHSCVGPEQFALTEGDACAGQNEPRSRHVVEEQCHFRGMDAPPACGSENVESLWQGSSRPLRLQRQLSLPNIFYKEHGCPGP